MGLAWVGDLGHGERAGVGGALIKRRRGGGAMSHVEF